MDQLEGIEAAARTTPSPQPQYQDVLDLLHERGVSDAGAVVHPDEDLEAVLGAIALWDKEPDGGAGLLVWMIREGRGAGYKPAHERTSVFSSEAPQGRGRSADEWYRILRGQLHRPGTHPDKLMADTMEYDDEEVWEMARMRAAG